MEISILITVLYILLFVGTYFLAYYILYRIYNCGFAFECAGGREISFCIAIVVTVLVALYHCGVITFKLY